MTLGNSGIAEAGAGLSWIEAGAQPCAALCDARWTLDRMRAAMPQDVHDAFARRISAGRPMTRTGVASGDVIAAVSFAKAGMPLVKLTRRIAQLPAGIRLPAEGHAVLHHGLEYRFVRVETWGNWALIVDAVRPSVAGRPSDGPIATALAGGGTRAGGGAAAGGLGGGGGLGSGGLASPDPLPTQPDGLRQQPSPVTPVPLPGGLALLVGGLTLFAAVRRRASAPRR